MKLVVKINLLFTVIVLAIVLVLAFLVYTVSRQNVHNDFKQRLKTRAARTAQLYSFFKTDSSNLLQSLDAAAPPALFSKNINIYSIEKKILYEYHDPATSLLGADENHFNTALKEGYAFYKTKDKHVYLQYNQVPGNRFLVMVAAENLAGREFTRELKRIFMLSIPGAVIIALAAGYLFSRNIIRPVKETIRDVELITSQNLSHRLYEGNGKDELARLNATFNNLLNRLEESFTIQRRFISNASHELSTPLTSVSSQIEVALLQDRSSAEYRQVLGSVLEDIQELHQLTRNLLEIAKAGTDGAISLEKIRIDEVLIKAHSELLKQYKNCQSELILDELPENENQCLVFGNSYMLLSAFKNILENGCKYSHDASVRAVLRFGETTAEIQFFNKSDMLTNEEITRLFEPFYRGKNAESKPGTGLGLTLTRRIIHLHKGKLRVQSNQESGTTVTIQLPTLGHQPF